jgi:hypothetical protein
VADSRTPNEIINDQFQRHAPAHLDVAVPTPDLARLADMAVAALRDAGRLPTGEHETEWCVWYGGDDPNECAGRLVDDDEGSAGEMVQWIVGGRLAYRTVHLGPWTAVADHG